MAAIHAHRQPFALSAAELRLLLASGTAAIARYFSSAQTSVEQTHLNDGLALDSNPNIVNLGSGVSLVKFLHVAITGARATVEANVTVWARSEARQASSGPWLMTDPVNIVDDKATLARSPSGTWQVTSLTGEPVPGYGP
jgi:hypothetical protein